jgi:hypothetical protein
MSSDPTDRLDRINHAAREHAFDIDAIPWRGGVDDARHFFPDDQVPLTFVPSWSKLRPDEQRQANQWYACAVSEQFIFLEEAFLMPATRALLRLRQVRNDPALCEALSTFLVEEEKHGQMFRRLLLSVDPDRYRGGWRHFYTPGRFGVWIGALCLRLPQVFVAWPWLGLILEEKTIAYHRAFERAAAAGVQLDPLHHAVHRFHFLDEARHVSIEKVLVEKLWDPASSIVKDFNRPLLFSALGNYTRPRRRSVSANIVRALGARFPRMAHLVEPLVAELMALRSDPDFQRQIYGHDAIPQTFRALQTRPELHGIDVVAPDFRRVADGAVGAAA